MERKKPDYFKQDRWAGGQSEDSRIGKVGSLRYQLGADTRTDSGKMGVLFKPVVDDGGVIAKLIKWIEINPTNNDTYYYGEDTIYKETGGTYTSVRTVGAGTPNGQGLCDFDGYLYYRTATTLGRYDYASTWTDSWQTGLESVTDFSPMCRFKNFLLVGHGRYIGTVDDVGTWVAQRLTLPPNYKVRSIFRAGSFAVILAIRGNTITDSEEGMMFYWNGSSETYNDYAPIDGNPHAGIAHKNMMVVISGQQPVIQHSQGGAGETMYSVPNVGNGKTAEIYAGAIDMWRGLVYFGISAGTSTTVLRVVHAWGSNKFGFEPILTPEYPSSEGTSTGTGMQITAVKRVGTTLRYAWKTASDQGVDEVDLTQYQTEAVVRTLAIDAQTPFEKNPNRVMVEFAGALESGEYVTAKLSPDPYGDPTFANVANDGVSITQSTVGSKELELPIVVNTNPIKSRDMHVELRYGGTGSTRPDIKRLWVQFTQESDQL